MESLISSRKAKNLAEALDIVIEEFRRADNRARLEAMTQAHYDGATSAVAEENELAGALAASVPDILFDE